MKSFVTNNVYMKMKAYSLLDITYENEYKKTSWQIQAYKLTQEKMQSFVPILIPLPDTWWKTLPLADTLKDTSWHTPPGHAFGVTSCVLHVGLLRFSFITAVSTNRLTNTLYTGLPRNFRTSIFRHEQLEDSEMEQYRLLECIWNNNYGFIQLFGQRFHRM